MWEIAHGSTQSGKEILSQITNPWKSITYCPRFNIKFQNTGLCKERQNLISENYRKLNFKHFVYQYPSLYLFTCVLLFVKSCCLQYLVPVMNALLVLTHLVKHY